LFPSPNQVRYKGLISTPGITKFSAWKRDTEIPKWVSSSLCSMYNSVGKFILQAYVFLGGVSPHTPICVEKHCILEETFFIKCLAPLDFHNFHSKVFQNIFDLSLLQKNFLNLTQSLSYLTPSLLGFWSD